MGLPFVSQTMTFAERIFDSKRTTEPMIQTNAFKPPHPRSFDSIRLERSSPESEGISSALIQQFLATLSEDKTLNVHSVSIVRNGKLLCEASFGAERTDVWKYSFSACKSVVSLAIGFLIDDGILSLDDRISDVFAKEASTINKLKLKDITVEDLLTMRSPALFAELDSAVEADWIKGYFSAPIKGEGGEDFRYNSLNTYILSAIICKKTGQSLSDFLDARLFSPLGIARSAWHWEVCPRGIEKGGWGLYIFQEDFCKIATLVMQKGVWKGVHLLSESYLEAAMTAHVHTKVSALFDYGYHIWVGKNTNTFLFNGMLGQNFIGFRDSGIIVACNSGNGEFFHQSNYFKYLLEYFDKTFPATLPKNKKAEKQLSRYVTSLSSYSCPVDLWHRIQHKLRTSLPTRNTASFCIVNQTFSHHKGYEKAIGLLPLALQMVQNCYATGFRQISFEKRGEKTYLIYEEQNATYEIPLGFSKPELAELTLESHKMLVATTAKFKRDEDDRAVLVIRIDFLEFPSSRILKLIPLDGQTALLKHEELPGKSFAVDAVRDHIGEYQERPILTSIIERIGVDFFEFKAERAFAPELIVKRSEKE